MTTDPPTISVVSTPLGYTTHCSEHGLVGALWYGDVLAGFDAIGHATVYHRPLIPPGARCWYRACTAPATVYRLMESGSVAVCLTHLTTPWKG